MVWISPCSSLIPDHSMCWECTFVSRKLLKTTSFHKKHILGGVALIILYLLIRKKKARVYREEDFKQYEREEGVIEITKPATFILHLNKDLEYVTLIAL